MEVPLILCDAFSMLVDAQEMLKHAAFAFKSLVQPVLG